MEGVGFPVASNPLVLNGFFKMTNSSLVIRRAAIRMVGCIFAVLRSSISKRRKSVTRFPVADAVESPDEIPTEQKCKDRYQISTNRFLLPVAILKNGQHFLKVIKSSGRD